MAVSLEGGFPIIGSAVFDNTNLSTSITVGSGANRLLVVMFAFEHTGSSVSTCKWNTSESLTRLGSKVGGTTWTAADCFYLKNPTATTTTLDSVPTGGGASFHWNQIIYVFDGVDQTTPLRAQAGAGVDTGTASSHTVSGYTAGDWGLDLIVLDSTGHTPAADAGQTADYATQNFGAGTSEFRGSNDQANGVMGWTWTTSAPNAHLATAVIPVAGAALLPPTRRYMQAVNRSSVF